MRILLGLVLGLIIGAIVDEARGAIWGALIGGLFGFLLAEIATLKARAASTDIQTTIDHIYRSLGDIHVRLTALERSRGGVAEAASVVAEQTSEPAPPAAATPHPAEEEMTAKVAPELAPQISLAVAPAIVREATGSEPFATRAQPPGDSGMVVWVRDWFSGGNALVRVGVIVLLFGVAFLLKYAAEHTRLPIEARLIGVAITAMVLLGLGWRLRERRRAFSIAVQGGGVGMLYLVVFAAQHLYHLIPTGAAFALLIAIVVFSAVLAVVQDALALAALGIAGGFLAPILISTKTGSHVLLFSYYTLLNAGILGIAWFRAWRVLNLLGFLFTATLGTFWAATSYRAEWLTTTEPFIVLFFVFYVAIAVLYALRQTLEPKRMVDGTLVFGTPLVAFGWQSALLYDYRFALAMSALAVSALYLMLARALLGQRRAALRLLLESFVALGIVFATLAIPLALDARWTAAGWALEGAAIVWVGVRQERILARVFGMLLQPAAGVAFLGVMDSLLGAQPVLNAFYIGCLFLALGGLLSAWLIERAPAVTRTWEVVMGYLLFAWGLAWWLIGGGHEIDRFLVPDYRPAALVAFVAGSALAFSLLARLGAWRAGRLPALALGLVLVLTAAAMIPHLSHPAAYGGWLAWPFALIVQYALLKRHEDANASFLAANHCVSLWLFTALLSWEAAWQIRQVVATGAWHLSAWALLPGLALIAITSAGERIAWPLQRHGRTYRYSAGGGLAAYLLVWTLYANVASDGSAAPLPYLPLLNPLDLAIAFSLLAMVAWLMRLRSLRAHTLAPELWPLIPAALSAAGFVWLTAVLLRSMHHWTDVPYELDALLRSMRVQTALSVFWSALALATMVYAVRTVRRAVWIAGAVLLAVVVVKLFLVDLSHVSGIERIISFLGVGVLLLAIGYFAPVPPRRASGAEEASA